MRPLWLIRSTLAAQFHLGRSGSLWPIKSTWLRLTWPSDFATSSGHARLSLRIDFTSGLLQHPGPLGTKFYRGTRFYIGRPGLLWSTRSTLDDQVHFGRLGPLWPTRSSLADQVHFGRSGPLRPTRSTLVDQVRPGRSGPLWPTRFNLVDQGHFGRSSPLGSG